MSALADPFAFRLATPASGLLRAFNDAGVLAAADAHVASRLGDLADEPSEAVRLAVALAVRGPRLGHVFADLATIRDTAAVESEEPLDLAALPWPDAGDWIRALTGSELVAAGEDDPCADRPLRLLGTRLYLDRYWREERSVADDLNELSASGRLSVIAGGPGTGKTTRAARIVARLIEAAPTERRPLIALAAPTGKAAVRLAEAVHAASAELPVSAETRALLARLRGSTLHRLLGRRLDSHSRFAHDRGNRLPHDVVIVDETSMVSLSHMARLVEAVRPEARLILVGDPGQLRSIEAGVVLADIVEAAPDEEARARAGIVVLDQVYRYGGRIALLADAIRRGDADTTIAALRDGGPEVTWLPDDVQEADLSAVKARALAAARSVATAARAGDGHGALRALQAFRLLCAHRGGPYGVSNWTSLIEGWLGEEIDLEQRDYVGRPLLVTENDYELGLFNGDTGVIIQDSQRRASAAFGRGNGELLRFSPLRLGTVETVYAMTIHKSQGSQFDAAAVLLPPADSRILNRELLYTAVTRARRELIVAGTEESVRRAVGRPVARASGLRERLRLGGDGVALPGARDPDSPSRSDAR